MLIIVLDPENRNFTWASIHGIKVVEVPDTWSENPYDLDILPDVSKQTPHVSFPIHASELTEKE